MSSENIQEPEVLGPEEEKNTQPDPFFEYLKSDKGHEILSRTIKIFEDIKIATLEKSTSHAKFEKWIQGLIVIIVIVATSILTYLGKFDSSIGVLFGTLVGYLFGKK